MKISDKSQAEISYENSLSFALQQDEFDPLKKLREEFYIPEQNGEKVIYFCGNSLGLQPKSIRNAIGIELDNWKNLAVEGHFKGENPWLSYHKQFKDPVAKLVGALPSEVVVMNNLTTNLHLMMVSFYQPDNKKYKILTESGAFPSDQYALESQVRFHGFDPETAIVELAPRIGEFMLRTEDIVQKIEELKDELALVMFGGVNYYTGQLFDLKIIAEKAQKAGVKVGFDLAHAAGNAVLQLHDWNVDFAVWCSYKYLNSGPGGVSGAFVHEKHANNPNMPRFAGWWGYEESTRFQMKKGFKPMIGADGWQLSNGNIVSMAAHKASLEIFEKAGMGNLRAKSEKLTGFLEFIINTDPVLHRHLTIITPKNPADRGCQLSILVDKNGRKLFDKISEAGLIGDWRQPDVIRLSPVPLYNSFEDVFKAGKILAENIEN